MNVGVSQSFSLFCILKQSYCRKGLQLVKLRQRLLPCRQYPLGRLFSTESLVEKKEEAESIGAAAKMKIPPFVKGLFLGKLNPEVLTYPELSNEELQTLKEWVEPIASYVKENVDSEKIDSEARIPDEVLQELKSRGLFGVQVPSAYGGKEGSAVQYARILEVIGLDAAIAVTLYTHQGLGIKSLLLEGNESQRAKYLPKLASGEWLSAFCLNEAKTGSDITLLRSRATLLPDGQTWNLSGTKPWVINGGKANFFIVFAQTKVEDHMRNSYDALTAFLVERDSPGITVKMCEGKVGIRGTDFCEVCFNNTPIPSENVLGKLGGGLKVAVDVLSSDRFCWGSTCTATLRTMLDLTTEYIISNNQQLKKSLVEMESVQEKMAKIAIITYAVESMTYLTAGLMDTMESDFSVESAIVKVFSTQGLWHSVNECLQIVGSAGYNNSHPLDRILRDTRAMLIFETSSDILKMYIALSGLQYAGLEIHETVKKLRNPLFHPGFILKKALQHFRHVSDNPKRTLQLEGFLHPSLQEHAKTLEYCVARLEYAVEKVLTYHGADVVNRHMALRRLAEIAINIYAMTAVLARSSRSYCIGLRNVDQEIMMAQTFCADASLTVKRLVLELDKGQFLTTDKQYIDISQKLFQTKGYKIEHPLARNF